MKRLHPKLVVNRQGASAQLWEVGGKLVRWPNTVLTLWWPTRTSVRPRLRLYFWRGRARHVSPDARHLTPGA